MENEDVLDTSATLNGGDESGETADVRGVGVAEQEKEDAATLDAFRRKHGFGRAISAPQIGIAQRFIAMNLGNGTFFMVNPMITERSEETFTMWDDCMSFSSLGRAAAPQRLADALARR